MSKPVIATDVDGIIVKWQSGLPYFAQKYNLPVEHILDMMTTEKFIKPAELFDCEEELAVKLLLKYNNSDFIRYLAPYADALATVNKLKEKYDFVAITALGNSVDANLNRRFNLNALFPDAFTEIMVCDYDESKDALLEKAKVKYSDRIVCYVDDLPKHIAAASKVFEDTETRVFYMPRGEREGSVTAPGIMVEDWHQIVTCLESLKSVKKPQKSLSGLWEEAIKDQIRKEQHPFNWPPRQVPGDWWKQPIIPFSPGPHVPPGNDWWNNGRITCDNHQINC